MTTIIPPTSARGMLRPGFCTSPAAIGMLFQPSYAHSAASIATPNAAKPLHAGVPEGVVRFDQVTVGAKKKTPPITMASPATFSTVRTDCTLPPKATVKQLSADRTKITATDTTCLEPNCQLIVCPKSETSRCAQT